MLLFLVILIISTANGFVMREVRQEEESEEDVQIVEKTVVHKKVDAYAAQSYLSQFGYIAPGNSIASGGVAGKDDTMRNAIMKFQDFAGLEKTGILDEKTKQKMAMPRCGIPDVAAVRAGGDEFILKWRKRKITYSIESYSKDLTVNQIKIAIRDAYNVWARVANIDFQEVPAGQGDIKVRFAVGYHDDPYPFDGNGNVLAHAMFPEVGALHFDDDENWTFRNPKKLATKRYQDLFAVAVHEGGHSLGLEHSHDMTSVMAPIIIETLDARGRYIWPKLKPRDIQAIQELYGRRVTPFVKSKILASTPMHVIAQRPHTTTMRTTTEDLFSSIFGKR